MTPDAPAGTGHGRPAAIVFGVLLLATFGAFFLASRLKAEPAVLADLKRLEYFSPNGDGRRDVEPIAFRAELEAFLDANIPVPARRGADFMGDYSDADIVPYWLRDWQALLFDNGWMIPGYPPELGGRNCTPVQTLIYLETMSSRRVPSVGARRRTKPARSNSADDPASWICC